MNKSRVVAREQQRTNGWIVWSIVFAGCILFFMSQAIAAIGDHAEPQIPELDSSEIITGSIPSGNPDAVNVRMQFIQQGSPWDNHVKVVLTPDDRALTMEEARSAARQAFLEALNDPYINDTDDLSVVTVVVHRFPGKEDPVLDFEIEFRSQGDGRWMIQD